MSRILIIDDDPDLLGACTVGLTALGHQVWTAQTGADGLDQAAIRAPEVIVLDLGLPDLDGLAVCKRIRTWSDVPIVVLSADGSEDRKVDALDQGADDYMTKPFGMRELNARVKVALRHHAPPGDGQPPEIDWEELVRELHDRNKKALEARRKDDEEFYMTHPRQGRQWPPRPNQEN